MLDESEVETSYRKYTEAYKLVFGEYDYAKVQNEELETILYTIIKTLESVLQIPNSKYPKSFKGIYDG